ncbi:MAG TPA: TerC family protein [Bacteroidota bacterium]|nr:TerC family protein [Bacteroidota bacterium]
MHTPMIWVGFNIFIVFLLMLDLMVFNKKPHEVSIKEALIWSSIWISLAMCFNVVVYYWFGYDLALQYFTGYVIEKSLSVDNLFVFLLLFSFFKVPPQYQHKVLYWGILSALVMRGVLILLGAALVVKFHWILLVFGAFLVVTGIKMAFQKEEKEIHPERNLVVRMFKKIIPVTSGYHQEKFFITINKKRYATLLIIVLIVVETTDLLFAVDSIPAVFAVSTDSFIIYSSNVFAILGLRSLYFALAGMINMFYYLRHGLSVILTFIGLKMLVADIFPIPIGVALGVVGSVLVLAVIASMVRMKRLQHK